MAAAAAAASSRARRLLLLLLRGSGRAPASRCQRLRAASRRAPELPPQGPPRPSSPRDRGEGGREGGAVVVVVLHMLSRAFVPPFSCLLAFKAGPPPPPAPSRHGLAAARGGLGAAPVHRRLFSNGSVLVELDESTGVAVMKMKSPPVNSLSLELLTEFSIGLEKLENNKACRGLILTSATPQIFSAGLDITEMCGKSDEHYSQFWKAVQEVWLGLYSSSLVTIAAVNGSSPAGGCLLALSCDYRIMAENPKYSIGLNETRLGIVAPFWFKDTLVNVVGHRAAERSLQLGLLYPPPDALKVGLVDEVVPEGKVQAAAAEGMAQWLAVPDHARQLSKSLMRKPTVDRLLAHREADIQDFVRFISRDAIQKSLQGYMERLKLRKA